MNQPRSCADWKPDLVALLDGELDSARKAEVTAHVSVCAECQADLSEIQATSAFVRQWEPAEPPRDLVPHSFAGHGPWRAAAGRITAERRLRDLFLPAGFGAALAAAAVVLLFRLGAMPTSDGREIQALAEEVALMRAELESAESALAQARSADTQLAARPAESQPGPSGVAPRTDPGTAPATSAGSAPASTAVMASLTPAERASLLKEVAAIIAASESRQDTKFLFTTDQLARSLSMQRREDLATIERQLRDSRAETFQALLSTHERLDRLARPAVLDRGLTPERELSGDEPKGKDGGQVPHEDRLEPRW